MSKLEIIFAIFALAGSAPFAVLPAQGAPCRWATTNEASAALGNPIAAGYADAETCIFEGVANDKEHVIVTVTRHTSEEAAGQLLDNFRRVRTNGSWVTGLGDGGAFFFNDKFGGILVLMKGKFSILVEVNRYDRQDPLPGLKTLAVCIIAKI
jgi:hypothetical protein